jgi:prephenate dehydratase
MKIVLLFLLTMNIKTIAIQGYQGSFHDEAAHRYFGNEAIHILPCDRFQDIADHLKEGNCDLGLMAIENSIAGTLLQNYRILRESQLFVLGEVYLRIEHNLLGQRGSRLDQIKQIASHPMAINQCLDFLKVYPHCQLISSIDTALSAKEVAEGGDHSHACIASAKAAEVYNLEVLAPGIETNKENYTRFFLVSHEQQAHQVGNKASIYMKVTDKRGRLLEVLQRVDDHHINLSKLQSYPVVGALREYYFHMDLEFDHMEQFDKAFRDISNCIEEASILGIYDRKDFEITKNKNQ